MLSALLSLSALSLPSAEVGLVGRNLRWATRGLGSELLSNLGRVLARPLPLPEEATKKKAAAEEPPRLAVVTGATGGIGAEVCMGLATSGYEVLVAARNKTAAQALVARVRASGGRATFFPLNLDSSSEALALAQRLRNRPVSLLINNAGTMGGPRNLTLRVNTLSPALLTLSLLPNLLPAGRVVNVGSSSHLRAGGLTLAANDGRRDRDLSAYAQSKLALMHFSSLLREHAPEEVVIHDCHPGLVWTPMLRKHLGPTVCGLLEYTGASRLLFRSPSQGAATVLTAALIQASESGIGKSTSTTYFINGRRAPIGASSPESRDAVLARRTWSKLQADEPILEQLARKHLPAVVRERLGGADIGFV